MKTITPDNKHPFRRICFVVIGLVTVVYITINMFLWMISDVMMEEPGMFIFLSCLLFVINITLFVLAIEEAVDYVKPDK